MDKRASRIARIGIVLLMAFTLSVIWEVRDKRRTLSRNSKSRKEAFRARRRIKMNSTADLSSQRKKQIKQDSLAQLIRMTGNPRRPFELIPAQEIKINKILYRINKYGYRGRPLSPKADGKRRIALFGGSTIFGVGLREDQTVGAMLKAVLNGTSGKCYDVLNFGMPRTNLIIDIEQYKHFKKMGFEWRVAVFYEDEFAFDLPGWRIVTDKWPPFERDEAELNRRLEESYFDGMCFHFIPSDKEFFSLKLMGYENGVEQLRSLPRSDKMLFVLNEVFRRDIYDHSLALVMDNIPTKDVLTLRCRLTRNAKDKDRMARLDVGVIRRIAFAVRTIGWKEN